MYSIEVLAVSSALTLFVVVIGAASGKVDECRCVASDNCWPDDTEWDAFNKTVGGRLIAPKPTGGLLMHASINFFLYFSLTLYLQGFSTFPCEVHITAVIQINLR